MAANQSILMESIQVSGFVFSDIFNNFKSPSVDLFVFDNVSVTLDSGSTTTSTFMGDLRMTGPLEPFKVILQSLDTIPVTASLETAGGLTKKISPHKLTLSSVAPFHVPLFSGVTLVKVSLQVEVEKKAKSWIFTPVLVGVLNIDGITDVDEDKIKFQASVEKGTLKLNAEGKNINGAFGLPQLMLDQITINGDLGAEKSLSITTALEVGDTSYKFDGTITPTAVGMVASVQKFNLDGLAVLFRDISPGKLQLPDFNVAFNKTSIALASADCTLGERDLEKGLTLATDLTAHDYTISATADITPDGVAFSGAMADIDIGPVKIKTAGLDFQIFKRSSDKPSLFTIHGETEIQHVLVNAGVYFEKQESSSWVTLLYATVSAKSLRLSTFFPETENSVMDTLSLSKMAFVVASADCTPQRLDSVSSVKKGLQLLAQVEEIPGLSELTGEAQVGLDLTAHIGSTIDIAVAIPDTRLDLGNSVTTEPIKMALFVAPVPSIALIFGMEVDIPNQPQPLHFDMMLDISPIEATGSVTMKNYWRNPFGINGVKIGPEVALQLGINYAQFASTGIPSPFGIAGGLAIGDTSMDMAVNISTNPMDEILAGSLKELDLKEIVVFATETVGLDIPAEDIPDFLDIKDLQFYIAPAGGMIGTITYERGVSFACDMVFMDKAFQFYTRISENGIEGAGKLDKIDIGPLKVSGNKGDDVSLSLALTPSAQKFSLDGAISFLGGKSSAFVDVSTKGVEFNFEQNFFNHLTFQIEGKSDGSISKPKSLDFRLAADMQNDITHFLKNEVSNKINVALHEATGEIELAQKEVDIAERKYKAEFNKADKELSKAQRAADAYLKKLHANVDKAKADYKREVSKAERELKKAKTAYDKAFNSAEKAVTIAEGNYNSGIASAQKYLNQVEHDYNSGVTFAKAEVDKAKRDYESSFRSAQNSVNSAQRKVDTILRDIHRIQREIDALRGWDKRKYPGLKAKQGLLWTSHKAASAALATANLFLEGVKTGGSFVAFQTAQTALDAAKTGAKYTAFNAAKASLHAAETGPKYVVFKGAKETLKAVKYGSKYTVWQAAEETLSLAKSAGNEAINSADQALSVVGSSAAFVALEAAKAGLKAVNSGTAFVAFGSAKVALEAAKSGSKAILGLADYIANHSGDVFDVRGMHISGSLKDLEKGDLFKSELDVSVLGRPYDWNLDLDIKDVESFLDNLFREAFKQAKAIAGV